MGENAKFTCDIPNALMCHILLLTYVTHMCHLEFTFLHFTFVEKLIACHNVELTCYKKDQMFIYT